MNIRIGVFTGLAVACLAVAAQAKALPPLSEKERVRAEFLAAAVGDEIRKNCPTISARFFRVYRRAGQLEDYARSLGYTDAQIDAMREDRAAKQQLKAMRDAYLQNAGVSKGDPESYCRLGRAEIAKNSLTGYLLRGN